MDYYKFSKQKHSPLSQEDLAHLSGTQKAALLLVALGKEHASEVIKYLPQGDLDKIFAEVARIDHLTPHEKELILNNFLQEIQQNNLDYVHGDSFARDILNRIYGEDKADEMLKKLSDQDTQKIFTPIEKVDPDTLATLLKTEHPQIITLVLSQLKPHFSAKIIAMLPDILRPDIVQRLAKMQKFDAASIAKAGNLIHTKIEQHIQKDRYLQAGGVEKVVDIFRNLPMHSEKNIIDNLDKHAPELAAQIKEKLVTFELIIELSNREMRILMERIPDDEVVAKSLKGAGDELRRHILSNVSRNRAKDIIRIMEESGAVRVSEIEEARMEIIQIARRLDREGYIILRKDKDEWIS